ncbi:cytochrome-c peroxidase [Corticibacter populi]|uniref:Cytochrome-c peroxidase n=2 Tax=Corticibacter populi TaxID=1550736 RepID=A0A3M6QWC4_9BURK|nr:cytochrome-c peroxidase [Corticibacter populi]
MGLGSALRQAGAESRAAWALHEAALLRQWYQQDASQWPPAWIDDGVAYQELGAWQPPPVADATGTTGAAMVARVALGRALFFDARLSVAGEVSCASCHQPARGWSSGTAVGIGHAGQLGRRNPPALHAVAGHRVFGWDGRSTSLGAQSLLALTRPDEMANPSLEPVLAWLAADADYATRFAAAYGPGAGSAGGDGPARPDAAQLGDALAAFLGSLDKPSAFDRFMQGQHTALSDQQIRGLHLFRTRARCANCHFGPLLSDGRFHNLKIASFGEPAEDLGRYGVTGQPQDAGAFRTPSLRHVAETAPYMHSGLFDSLDGVIRLYERGGGEVWARNAQEAAAPLYRFAVRASGQLRPLTLSEADRAALRAFLQAL